ncbi:hypothetical protein L6452_18685 [Arctium lappa]|uniref:Uncharacterized protein n=1 Tax=Arctium lappa TaxID=4217 RepID=A0ACB9C6V7_ARCLA|nr:hypothetical protein L6452_18685 [Arctium lappa]
MAARSFLYGGASGGGNAGDAGDGGGGGSVQLTNKRVHCSSSSLNPVDSFFLARSSSFHEDEPITNAVGFSSSDCEESIVSSPVT